MKFFKNYRVYILTSVAYLGSLLFGMFPSSLLSLSLHNVWKQATCTRAITTLLFPTFITMFQFFTVHETSIHIMRTC